MGYCEPGRFGSTTALDGLTMAVPTGQVHGFLGPNGAGKSTTIRVLLGLLRADAGTAKLLGGDPWHDAASLHRRLAYVPGDVNLWPNLTGGEAIDVIGRARGGLDKTKRAALIERFDLDPKKKDLPGEVVTFANEYLGTVRVFVPFGEQTEDGWHIRSYLKWNASQLEQAEVRAQKRRGAAVANHKKGAHAGRFDSECLTCQEEATHAHA